MNLKLILKNSVKITVGGIGFVSSFYTMIELMYFLSDPNYNRKVISQDPWLSASWSLLINMALLSVFILQHSLLAVPPLKDTVRKYGLQDLYRSFYVIATMVVLQIFMKNWHDIPELTLWKFNLNFRPFWLLYISIHVTAWLVIYIGNICMDINELIGIKQIYYSIINLPDPNLRKSFQLQRLNSHMRHPSFLAFVLIFWFVPVMSLDRLLLAAILTLYMFISWNTDESDYAYQYSQYKRKFHELENLQS
ncbi:nurim homolog [Tribolium madens]|uniref:nurim homolog n=1 Tax=Tribolium madens TaxID=41895 RepID=UPI001CF73C2F|nr:nurim homolog [Tribolium madens]